MDFDNGGKTPATEIHVTAHVLPPTDVVHAREKVDSLGFEALGKPEGRDPASAGSHEWNESSVEEICESGACIRQTDANNMINGDADLYIYGVLQYRDIFRKQHATRFCYFRPSGLKCPMPGGCLDTCPFGNWLDKPGDPGVGEE